MRGLRLFTIALVAVAVGLFVSNPDMEDFTVYAKDKAGEMIMRELGTGAIADALSSLGSSLTESFIDRVTERSNYFLWSTYTIGDPESERGAFRFLGVGGRFVQLESPGIESNDG